jgi:hypothetical protein
MAPMPPFARVPGPLGVAVAAWDVWRRLSPKQRRLLLAQMRKHGPKVAEQALGAYRAFRRGRPPA